MHTIKKTVGELEELFESLNSRFFDGELSRPVISLIYNRGRRLSYGWCSVCERWEKTDSKEKTHEINICPEFLSRPITDVCETMLHEMVHLYNIKNGVKDTSRSGSYHNKRFKKAAEAHGLNVEFTKDSGWSLTELQPEAAEFCRGLDISSFDTICILPHRVDGKDKEPKGKEKKKNKNKYVCPVCNNEIKAKKEVNIICGDCNEHYVKESEGEEDDG